MINIPTENFDSIVILDGKEANYAECVNLMDDDIREELHNKLAPCTDQEFLDAYVDAHFKKFNQEFAI